MNKAVLRNITDWLKENWIYLVIFVILLVLRIIAIDTKTSFFFDDVASFNASTPNNTFTQGVKYKYSWADIRFEHGKNYKAYEVKKLLFESKPNLKSICKDLATLHSETLDRQHPNLYYSILRVWSSGVDYSDANALKWRGCSLNLIFFAFSFFFMFKLLNLIKPEKKFIALGLFFAFVSTGAISNTLLIRPYPLMEVFFTFALYYLVVMYKAAGQNINFTKKQIILYSLGICGFLLINYYSMLLLALIFIAISCRCFQTDDIKTLKTMTLTYGLAIVLTLLFCPLYLENFKNIEHMPETKDAATLSNFLDFHWYGLYLFEILSKFVFYNIVMYIILFAMAIVGIPVFNDKKFSKEETKYFALICMGSFLWAYLICTICPFHEYPASRYVIACVPIFGLLLGMINYRLRIQYLVISIIITLIASFVPARFDITAFNSKYKNFGVISFFKDFEYFNINKDVNRKDGSKRPVVIANRNWIWPNYIVNLDNDTIIRFEDNVPPKNYVFKDYVLINTEDVSVVRNRNNYAK